jgi:hypothetical protein
MERTRSTAVLRVGVGMVGQGLVGVGRMRRSDLCARRRNLAVDPEEKDELASETSTGGMSLHREIRISWGLNQRQ